MSIRALPAEFPDDIVTLGRVPYEASADAVMYRRVLAELALERHELGLQRPADFAAAWDKVMNLDRFDLA